MLVSPSTELIEIGHCVALRHFILAELIEVRLDERTILASFTALVIEAGRNGRLLLRKRCVIRVKLVGSGVLATPWLLG